MKPIFQSIRHDDQNIGNGDCVDACYASLFDLPLWMVPPFCQMQGRTDRSTRISQWAREAMKCQQTIVHARYILDDKRTPEERTSEFLAGRELPEFWVGIGPTSRGTHHATIWSGDKMVHDPLPGGNGLLYLDRIEYFTPIAEVTPEFEASVLKSNAELVQRMIVSSVELYEDGKPGEEDAVVGYEIKTGALHLLVNQLQACGYPIIFPINLPCKKVMP